MTTHKMHVEYEAVMRQIVSVTDDGDLTEAEDAEAELIEWLSSPSVFCSCTPVRALRSEAELRAHGIAPDWQYL